MNSRATTRSCIQYHPWRVSSRVIKQVQPILVAYTLGCMYLMFAIDDGQLTGGGDGGDENDGEGDGVRTSFAAVPPFARDRVPDDDPLADGRVPEDVPSAGGCAAFGFGSIGAASVDIVASAPPAPDGLDAAEDSVPSVVVPSAASVGHGTHAAPAPAPVAALAAAPPSAPLAAATGGGVGGGAPL